MGREAGGGQRWACDDGRSGDDGSTTAYGCGAAGVVLHIFKGLEEAVDQQTHYIQFFGGGFALTAFNALRKTILKKVVEANSAVGTELQEVRRCRSASYESVEPGSSEMGGEADQKGERLNMRAW